MAHSDSAQLSTTQHGNNLEMPGRRQPSLGQLSDFAVDGSPQGQPEIYLLPPAVTRKVDANILGLCLIAT